MRLALYQPDIPQNTGTLLRLGACLDLEIDIIEPCGFIFNEKAMRRAGMDYLDFAKYQKHKSWDSFLEHRKNHPDEYGRIILLTTKGQTSFVEFDFKKNDIILMGRESAGVPEAIHNLADAQLIIPMNPEARSINMAISASMAITEALRQTNSFPKINK